MPATELSRDELKNLLLRGWMTHDAMWFKAAMEDCGVAVADRLNRAAVRSMAAIEVRRMMKALGLREIRHMDDLRMLFEGAWGLIKGDFMAFVPSYPAPNTIRWDVPACFAFDGIRQLGAIEAYNCGIFLRLETWLDTLGIKYQVTPRVEGCMMHREGRCFREYRFDFGTA